MDHTYRLRPHQLPWLSVVIPAIQLLVRPPGIPPRFWAFCLAAGALGIVLHALNGVQLRPDCLVIRQLRRHEVSWRQIDEMHKAKRFGTRHVVVRSGAKVWRLPAPVSTVFFAADRGFDAKADEIWRYWQERRAAALVP